MEATVGVTAGQIAHRQNFSAELGRALVQEQDVFRLNVAVHHAAPEGVP